MCGQGAGGSAVLARDRPLVTYVLPISSTRPPADELTRYLHELALLVPVIVVDGSPDQVRAAHRRAWGGFVRHLPVESRTLNGKVAGVVDGVTASRTPYVVVADDDVRYDLPALRRLLERLHDSDAVLPQNYFTDLPWHARWDTGRTLLNRALGHDYPGTLGVRREAFLSCRGYCGAVLFENLELTRTLTAHGYRVAHARDIFVGRRPPDTRQFLRQRIRQAYDSRAQPARFALELAGLPVVLLSARRVRRLPVLLAAVVVGVAEVGRRRDGGRGAFDRQLPLWAPAWALERSICAWLALGSGWCGGVHYIGTRLRTAAHPVRVLSGTSCPEPRCSCDTVLRPSAHDTVLRPSARAAASGTSSPAPMTAVGQERSHAHWRREEATR